MEPASLYMLSVAAVAGAWILGDALWAVALNVATRVSSFGVGYRLTVSTVSMVIALSLIRMGPVGADLLPPHQRVIVDPEPRATGGDAIGRWLTSVVDDRPATGVDPGSYVVVRGDSLWKIARNVLSADGERPSGAAVGTYWRSIYDTNRNVIGDNPNLIFPGQIFQLPQR
jgi:hypothetical protein